ncbi:DNA polymerase III subunit delta [Elongatibacter sediminis]|uniref:DNA polymerase III subunit delta n=1 Tax=Elongatibacter sediminis TaxID=3119006 RepID=A0AAW9R7I5_9GAMM
MNLRPDRLKAALEKGLAPVYLIAGSEPLIVEECRDAVLAAGQRQGFTERTVHHVDARFDWDTLESEAMEQSLFASRKIVDVRLPTGKPGKEGGKQFVQWAERPDPDRLLLISSGAWDGATRKTKWASTLAAAGVLVEIWPVRPHQMPEWVEKRMRSQGLSPDREAVTLLAEHVEGNLLAARQEVEKLALLHPGGEIRAEQVRDAVSNNARFDAFRLIDCLLAGRASEALRVADGLRRTGVPIQMVAGALYYQFAMLAGVGEALGEGENEARAFGRFRVFKMQQPLVRKALQRLGPTRLGRAFSALSRVDLQSKGQAGGDSWNTLDHLIVDFCAPRGAGRAGLAG